MDPKPHTLKFVLGTTLPFEGWQQDGAQADASRAKVFIRLRLMSPDKKEALKLPFFPVRAPHLQPEASSQTLSSWRAP